MVGFENKKALVTGGSGDIGRAMCRRLAAAGAEVGFTYFSDHDGAARTAAEVAAAGGAPARVFRANFADLASTRAVLDEVRGELGRVDIFISNAASGVFRSADALTPRHLQWAVDVGARAFLLLAQGLACPGGGASAIMGRGGRVVALSSLGAVRAIPQYTILAAAKAALEAMVRHLALELGPRGITVNAVSPGLVETGALAHFPNRDHLLDVARSRTPMGRLTTAEDVADVVLFLCSDAGAMVHGQTLNVDGGYSIVG
ncbi:SDR family oxidoreductase [Haliangium sp.]|uniref:SDR family oxidoreductase n=1 Tax=Haliangium sp. TaxID=2663208 RepID=UPI003D12FA2C